MIWQRWVSRSRVAPVRRSDPTTSVQDSNAQAAPARMWGATLDAEGLPVAEQEVPIEVVDNGDGPILQVSPDPAFFTRSDVTYPVTIDPATDLSADADTYVRSDQSGTSYGNDTVLLAGRDSSR